MQKLRMGMIGGGEGAFIGPIHRMAAELDGFIELVCGAFASDPERSVRSGQSVYGLPENRCYPDFETMLAAEAALPESQRMQLVAIVTPNHLHYPAALACLQAGFHVVCDKPVTVSAAQARALSAAATDRSLLFGITYTYSGYPMVREARERIQRGELGAVRRVVVEYFQGWLADAQEQADNKQAGWRTDPQQAGVAGCMGDIGTHAEHLVSFVTGLAVTEVCADLSRFVEGRLLDDDANVLLRLESGARGVLMASQVAIGEDNALRLRIYGEQGSLVWAQQTPNELRLMRPDESVELLRSGGARVGIAAGHASRLPAGHPEGYLEAFANLYRGVAQALRSAESGQGVALQDCPDINDGVRSMEFLEAVVASAGANGAWTSLDQL